MRVTSNLTLSCYIKQLSSELRNLVWLFRKVGEVRAKVFEIISLQDISPLHSSSFSHTPELEFQNELKVIFKLSYTLPVLDLQGQCLLAAVFHDRLQSNIF